MSVNKYEPHLLILPEDRADSQIANGFLLHPNINNRAVQVLPYIGGWSKVLNEFTKNHSFEMQKYPYRMMVLLIDFDNDLNRRINFKNDIPNELKERVFVLGVLSEPENLKKSIKKTFEEIGESLANECANGKNGLWNHELLQHNETELNRMLAVKECLFSS